MTALVLLIYISGIFQSYVNNSNTKLKHFSDPLV